jgi:ribonuclease H2 subunit A
MSFFRKEMAAPMLEQFNKFFSNIDKIDTPVIAGIDEAGRGPVAGPMVYALYVTAPDAVSHFKDSKVLTASKREFLFKDMTNFCYISVSPIYISSHMLANSLNLNDISRQTVLTLLKELKEKCSNVQCVYIDGLGNNSEYKSFLKQHYDYNYVIENKADSKYQVVSGASIVAKVTRDIAVEELDCGSGYPSDPSTKAYVESEGNLFSGYAPFIRHSWANIKSILGEKEDRELVGSLNGFYTGPY